MHLNKVTLNRSNGKASAQDSESMEAILKNRNKKKFYWICQVTGWSVYALLNLAGMLIFDAFSMERTISFLFLCFAGISFTHLLRSIIWKQGWLQLPLKKLIPRIIIASLVIGTILFLLYSGINAATGITKIETIKPAAPLVWISNLSSVILVWILIYFSVSFFDNYKRAEIESLIWEAAVKDFELKTLKSQLNPHFMFNAMNSIRALIEEDPESAKTALTKLSNILRYSLKIERTETVPLEEEMQTVKDYLALEAIRYEERLDYNIEVDPGSYNIEIPPMMIQTLVENGIKHGIAKRTEGGNIRVSTLLNGQSLKITISNSGSITEESIRHSSGFGINNTKHRLNLLYGGQAHFSIKNEDGDQVTAEIIIPTGGKNESINS